MGLLKKAFNKLREVGRKLGYKIAMFALRRKVLETSYHVATVVATGVMLWFFLPLWMGVMIFTILYLHEMGHYFQAKRLEQDPWLPFFIPWGYGVSGHTLVGTDSAEADAQIALAGPTVGIVVSVIGLALAIGFNFVPAMWFAGWMVGIQVFQGTLGSDGRRYRKARKLATNTIESQARPATSAVSPYVPLPT